jgi:hypothetical protein
MKAKERTQSWPEGIGTLDSFQDYLQGRTEEVGRALNPGAGLDSGDPYLNGFGDGVIVGLKLAKGFIFSYMESTRRGIDKAVP